MNKLSVCVYFSTLLCHFYVHPYSTHRQPRHEEENCYPKRRAQEVNLNPRQTNVYYQNQGQIQFVPDLNPVEINLPPQTQVEKTPVEVWGLENKPLTAHQYAPEVLLAPQAHGIIAVEEACPPDSIVGDQQYDLGRYVVEDPSPAQPVSILTVQNPHLIQDDVPINQGCVEIIQPQVPQVIVHHITQIQPPDIVEVPRANQTQNSTSSNATESQIESSSAAVNKTEESETRSKTVVTTTNQTVVETSVTAEKKNGSKDGRRSDGRRRESRKRQRKVEEKVEKIEEKDEEKGNTEEGKKDGKTGEKEDGILGGNKDDKKDNSGGDKDDKKEEIFGGDKDDKKKGKFGEDEDDKGEGKCGENKDDKDEGMFGDKSDDKKGGKLEGKSDDGENKDEKEGEKFGEKSEEKQGEKFGGKSDKKEGKSDDDSETPRAESAKDKPNTATRFADAEVTTMDALLSVM